MHPLSSASIPPRKQLPHVGDQHVSSLHTSTPLLCSPQQVESRPSRAPAEIRVKARARPRVSDRPGMIAYNAALLPPYASLRWSSDHSPTSSHTHTHTAPQTPPHSPRGSVSTPGAPQRPRSTAQHRSSNENQHTVIDEDAAPEVPPNQGTIPLVFRATKKTRVD